MRWPRLRINPLHAQVQNEGTNITNNTNESNLIFNRLSLIPCSACTASTHVDTGRCAYAQKQMPHDLRHCRQSYVLEYGFVEICSRDSSICATAPYHDKFIMMADTSYSHTASTREHADASAPCPASLHVREGKTLQLLDPPGITAHTKTHRKTSAFVQSLRLPVHQSQSIQSQQALAVMLSCFASTGFGDR